MIKEIRLKLDDGTEIVLNAPFRFRSGSKPLSVISRGIETPVPDAVGRNGSIYALVITDGEQTDHFINHDGEYYGWGREVGKGEERFSVGEIY